MAQANLGLCNKCSARVPSEFFTRDGATWIRKTCPACGKQLRAAALRCRFCNVQFDTVEAVSREDHDRLSRLRKATEAARRRARLLLVAGLLPCTAPFTLVVGASFLRRNREALAQMSPLERLAAQLGVGLAAFWLLVSLVVLGTT